MLRCWDVIGTGRKLNGLRNCPNQRQISPIVEMTPVGKIKKVIPSKRGEASFWRVIFPFNASAWSFRPEGGIFFVLGITKKIRFLLSVEMTPVGKIKKVIPSKRGEASFWRVVFPFKRECPVIPTGGRNLLWFGCTLEKFNFDKLFQKKECRW